MGQGPGSSDCGGQRWQAMPAMGIAQTARATAPHRTLWTLLTTLLLINVNRKLQISFVNGFSVVSF